MNVNAAIKRDRNTGPSTTIRLADGHEATSLLASKAANLTTDDRALHLKFARSEHVCSLRYIVNKKQIVI
jgi:hypothetical protein